jgi:cytochrome c556
MRKTIILAAGVLMLSGIRVLAQQGDPIYQRQALMKNNQEQLRALTGMARGQAPFNAMTAQAALQRIEQNA